MMILAIVGVSVIAANDSKPDDKIEIADSITKTIHVDKTKDVLIEGVKYNLVYDEKPQTMTVKCICEKVKGCTIKECLS